MRLEGQNEIEFPELPFCGLFAKSEISRLEVIKDLWIFLFLLLRYVHKTHKLDFAFKETNFNSVRANSICFSCNYVCHRPNLSSKKVPGMANGFWKDFSQLVDLKVVFSLSLHLAMLDFENSAEKSAVGSGTA